MRPAVFRPRSLMCFVVFAAWAPVSLEAQAADYISVKRPLDEIKQIDLKQVYPQPAKHESSPGSLEFEDLSGEKP